MIIFSRKFSIFFLIFAQNIDCGYTLEPPRQGGSNEYPQSMFWSKNKKNTYTPAYPSFCYIKVGFEGVNYTRTCFPDEKLKVGNDKEMAQSERNFPYIMRTYCKPSQQIFPNRRPLSYPNFYAGSVQCIGKVI